MEYKKEEFKDLAELLMWVADGKPVYYGGLFLENSVGQIRDYKKHFTKYKKAIEIKEREKIKLMEYICDAGYVRFLTSDFKSIIFYSTGNRLIRLNYYAKCTLAPDARTIYAWKDSLEYCSEGEG